MTYINPITGAVLPAALAQDRIAAEKDKQLRRNEALRRTSAAGDRYEPVVESTQAIEPVQDDPSRRRGQSRSKARKNEADDSTPPDEGTDPPEQHIDLKI